jgi:hypothetical protein
MLPYKVKYSRFAHKLNSVPLHPDFVCLPFIQNWGKRKRGGGGRGRGGGGGRGVEGGGGGRGGTKIEILSMPNMKYIWARNFNINSWLFNLQ